MTRRRPETRAERADFDSIRKALPKLSAQQIRDLRQLLDTYFTPEAATNSDTDWLFSGIADVMRSRGLGCPPLTPKFVSKDVFAQAAAVKEILAKRAQRSGGSLSTTQWLALGKVCAKALATLISSWKVQDETTQAWKPVPLSVRVMLTNIAKVPEALEADFPGYLEAGLLHLLVRVRDPDDKPADPPEGAPYAPPGKEHLDEFAEAEEEDWRRRQQAWKERHEAEREAEREQARSWNKKLGHDPPPPPSPPDTQDQYDEGEDEGPQDDED